LVLGCRNQERGQAALQAIQATGFKNVLSLHSSTSLNLRPFQHLPILFVRGDAQIDVLVYNAGVALLHYSPTNDGWEETIQVNHLSAMLLTILLLPCLFKAVSVGTSPNPRIVIVQLAVTFTTTGRNFPKHKWKAITSFKN